MIARDIMKTDVITVSPSSSVTDASSMMREKNIGCLVVVDNERRPIGIITDRDIVVTVVAEQLVPAEILVEDVMTKNLVTVKEDESVFEILRVLARNSIRRVPVLRGVRLVGIVSVDDLIVLVVTELSNLASALSSTSKVL
ncbi:MAG: CBS domain-containing protein [Deltaproteobacteria bacterium]|nr:CBS domain-containing protein [Deltaproteobacteria bacterium]